MKKKPNDRGLMHIAKLDIKEADETYVNFAMFHISQAVEKILKFLCRKTYKLRGRMVNQR